MSEGSFKNQEEDNALTMFWDVLDWAKNTWNEWDLKAIVLFSMTLQLMLLILGRLRSRMTKSWVRFIIWISYLMASWIATIGIGKLSGFDVKDPYFPDTETALKALLAPLFLLHLGSPDTITAYSIEDNQLGLREIFEAAAQIGLVIWVLFKCWTYTKLSFLTIPMFCAGLIKYAERAWSLWFALHEDVGVTTSVIEEKRIIPELFKGLGKENADASLILKAYYRFDHLKPHLENWVYRPYYLRDGALSLEYDDSAKMVDEETIDDPKNTFKITDIELGFMYDALYTKSPLIYSRVGFVLRFVAFIGIVLTFGGFVLLFKPNFQQKDITFTYAMLLVAVCVELYSDARLLFTDRAIVWMTMQRFHDIWLLKKLVQFLAWRSKRKKRWSNHLYQFNILTFCLTTRHRSLMTKFLGLCCLDERWEKHNFKREIEICKELKVLVLEKMDEFDKKRKWKPYTKCGKWSLKLHQSSKDHHVIIPDIVSRECTKDDIAHETISYEHNKDDIMHRTICTEFGRSVAIWHLATDLCYYVDDHQGALVSNPCKKKKVSKMLSDYMMHLLVNVPDMLSIPSGPIIFKHLHDVLMLLLDPTSSAKDSSSLTQNKQDESWACELILKRDWRPENEKVDGVAERHMRGYDPVNELSWSILPEAKELAENLSKKENKWETILSVWVEMLCYAADNCALYNHAEQLRRGGEFLTPIWLLISHNSDKFNTATCV